MYCTSTLHELRCDKRDGGFSWKIYQMTATDREIKTVEDLNEDFEDVQS